MSLRWIAAVVATSALLLSGCGGSKAPAPSASSKSSSAESSAAESTAEQSSAADAAPVQTLDPSACTDLTGANLDLAVATNADDAKKAADIFGKYNPPPDVQEAVDHFVQTQGAQFDDPDFDKFNSAIDNWVKAVCPL
jgi:ABC-type enterochelin transport system substrate-binding protein